MNTVKNYTTIYLKLNYRCVESCNSLNDLSNKVCVPNKKEELNLSVFNMITWINEAKTKHISCECKCQFDRKKWTSDQWWNNDKCQYEYKKRHIHKKDYIGILLHEVAKVVNIYSKYYEWFSNYLLWNYSH